MRVVVAIALIGHAALCFETGVPVKSVISQLFTVAAGFALLVGFWTPIAGCLVMVLEIWEVFSRPVDPWPNILLGSMGVALALIGPGALSVDARRFGWKRIGIRDQSK